MSQNDKITDIYLTKAQYYYEFDLSDGIITKDIIDRDGKNYLQKLGLSVPCSFDEMMRKLYHKNFLSISQASDEQKGYLTSQYLINAFRAGERLVEETYYVPEQDEYHRVSYYLVPNRDSQYPHVYACCIDITDSEKRRENVFGDLQIDKNETEDIIASAQIGIWHIILFEGEKPRLQATSKMLELLGVEDQKLTEEELYEFWHSRIKKSSGPSVEVALKQIIEEGFAEITYVWKHPTKRDSIVRCGGTCKYVEGKGYILRGYHSDVTETVNAETKQKQLLAEALDEVKHQKKLLQNALDNYKEADYDRRRDFLTGLRNRQDMFELLQDVLSEKHENIKSMYMMDIDNFKMLNDHYGHIYGDDCLKKIGAALKAYGKENDIYFYRYGGEEILGICFSEKKEAEVIAGEIVKLVSDLKIERYDLPTGVVTISLGYTTDNQRYEKMIDKADTAMYRAKESGKNRFICYESEKSC